MNQPYFYQTLNENELKSAQKKQTYGFYFNFRSNAYIFRSSTKNCAMYDEMTLKKFILKYTKKCGNSHIS